MVERYLIVDRLKFSYEGLLNVSETYAMISTFFYDKGWDYREHVNQELVTPNGKQFRFVLQPFKTISDYFKIHIHMKINFFDIKEVEVEHDGQTIRMGQGLMRLMIDAYVQSDTKGWWQNSPWQWFIKVIITKYYFNQHLSQAKDWLESDVGDLYEKLRTFLNAFNYRYRNN